MAELWASRDLCWAIKPAQACFAHPAGEAAGARLGVGIPAPQPRKLAGIDAKTRFRNYVNLHRTEQRLRSLLRDFEWGRMDEIFLARTPGAH